MTAIDLQEESYVFRSYRKMLGLTDKFLPVIISLSVKTASKALMQVVLSTIMAAGNAETIWKI